jgi:flagellar FliL protein
MAKEAEKNDAAAATAAAAAPSGMAAWLPILAVVVLVPVISFAMAEFVLFPRLVERLGGGSESTHATGSPVEGGESHGEGGHGAAMESHEFTNVVSNLSGSMKSRYIKVSFTAYSSNPNFKHLVEQNHAKILDTALSVLGSLTLAELEDATVKNRMRADMVSAFETLLRGRVIEEIYFSEFVVQ